MRTGAVFSPDRMYRYELWRIWDGDGQTVSFVGLNPSTADEEVDDPTIRRCLGFAQRWGYGRLVMVNIFAFRATDPAEMRAAVEPVGPANDSFLESVAGRSDLIVAAWGTGGAYRDRGLAVSYMLGSISALGFTRDGHPRHPLYVRADANLVAFNPVGYDYGLDPR